MFENKDKFSHLVLENEPEIIMNKQLSESEQSSDEETMNTNRLYVESQTSSSFARPIGGWLYLLAFGLIFSLIKIITLLLTYNLKTITDGTWDNLTTQTSILYHPIYLPTLSMELFSNIIIFLFLIASCYLFVKKDKNFPILYSFALFFSLVLSAMLLTALEKYPTPNQDVIKEQSSTLLRLLFGSIFWITYLKKSKRVKETFTKNNIGIYCQINNIFFITPFLIICAFFLWILLVSGKTTSNLKAITFTNSYHENFIRECTKAGSSESVCNCGYGKVTKEFSPEEMRDIEYSNTSESLGVKWKNFISNEMPKCRK